MGTRARGCNKMRFALFVLLASVLLVLPSFGYAAWWDSDYTYKRAIELPDQDYNAGNAIQLEIDFTDANFSGKVLSSCNDVRVVDENKNVELDRIIDGNCATSTDANVFFLLDHNMTAGNSDRDTTYYLYYDNSDAGAASDDNAARHDVCTWEWGDCYVWFGDLLDQNTDFYQFGVTSGADYDISPTAINTPTLGAYHDFNYTTWTMARTGASRSYFGPADNQNNICYIGFGTAITFVGSSWSSGVSYSKNTWYKFQIHYEDEDANCQFAVFDTSGDLLAASNEPASTPGTTNNMTMYTDSQGDGDWIHYDNSYLAPPTVASGVGEEEPGLNLTIVDENRGYPLTSITATFNGETYTTDSEGEMTIPIAGLDGRYTLTLSEDDNYSARYFDFDLNTSVSDSIDLQLSMINDDNGLDTDFLFYDTDQATVLSNKKVYVLYGTDMNYASIRYTDGSGQVSFFLDPDDNYLFQIVNSETDVKYFHPTKLTIKIPKDEATSGDISPFNVSGSQLSQTSWSGQTAAVTYYLLANTVGFYQFDVNGGLDYYPRDYLVNLKGNPATHTLQPYLGKRLDSSLYTFYVFNTTTGAGLEGVRIVIKRQIAGQGLVVVNELETDAAGIVSAPLIIGETYYFDFYYDGELKKSSAPITPTTAVYTYQVELEVDVIDYEIVTFPSIDLNFLPDKGMLYLDDANFVDFNVAIGVKNGTIEAIDARVVNCVDINRHHFVSPWTDGNQVTYHFDANSEHFPNFDTKCPIQLIIDVNLTDGNSFREVKTFTIAFRGDYDIMRRLQNLANDLNPSGTHRVTSFLAFFISMIIVGGVAAGGFRDPIGLGILTGVLLGFFFFIGFIPFNLFLFAAYAGGMVAILIFGRSV